MKVSLVTLCILFISLISVQAVSSHNLIGQGYIYGDGIRNGSWEIYNNGIGYVWTDGTVIKLTFCQRTDPPYSFIWEWYRYDPGDPRDELSWSPHDHGVGRMAGDPTLIKYVETEMLFYCSSSGPEDTGAGWTPKKYVSRGLYELVNDANNTLNATLFEDYTYGGDITTCGICTNTIPGVRGHYAAGGGQNVGMPAEIQGFARHLVFINEKGEESPGTYRDDNTVVASNWSNLVGHISDDKNRIDWDNGNWWIRNTTSPDCTVDDCNTYIPDLLIEYHVSGGFAGIQNDLYIFENGTVLRSLKPDSYSWSINQSKMDQLRGMLSNASFSSFKEKYIPEYAISDAFYYSITYQRKKVSFEDGTDIPVVLKNITTLLKNISE